MKKRESERAAGLTEVLIVIGILGIVSLGVSKLMTGTFSLQKKASIDDERLGLYAMLRKGVSCDKTYEGLGQKDGTCGPYLDKPIPLRRSNDVILSEEKGSKVGKWGVKAVCRSTGIDVSVAYTGNAEVADFNSANSFFRDPVNKQLLDFNHPKNQLFPQLCSDTGATETDFDCVTARRTQNAVVASRDGVVKKYDHGTPGTETMTWGLTCEGRFNRMACSITTPTKVPSDADVSYMSRGCFSDNDEWDGAFTLHIICCRLKS